jgi:hypothetical protein
MKKDSTSFLKGMHKQSSLKQQPKGTWNFALNALFGSWDGDSSSLTNEIGNEPCINLGEDDFTLIGSSILPDNKLCLFFTGQDSFGQDVSIIGIHDPINCEFELKVKTTCLGFRRHQQIDAINRILKGCERVVYFTDKNSSYKAINLDSLQQYLAVDINGDAIYSVDDANIGNNYMDSWNCIKFNHFLAFTPGCITVEELRNGGGKFKGGAHQFAIRYLDGDQNPTNWSPLTYPLYIYSEDNNNDFADGEGPDTEINKTVILRLDDLDVTYPFVQIAVLSAIQGTGNIDEVWILEKLVIDGPSIIYNFFGPDETIHTISSVEEIVVPRLPFTGVVAHETIDNRLLLANVANSVEDYATFQRAVLFSRVKWRMWRDYASDPYNIEQQKLAETDALILMDGKNLMRDEIYALGVVFLFEDGTESPVFNIPGRPKDTDYDGVDINTYVSANGRNYHISRGNNFPTYINQWDSKLLNIVPDGSLERPTGTVTIDNSVGYSNTLHLLDDTICPGGIQNTPTRQLSAVATFSTITSNADGVGKIQINGLQPGEKMIIRCTVAPSVLEPAPSQNLDVTTDFLTDTNNISSHFTYRNFGQNFLTVQFIFVDANGVHYKEITSGAPMEHWKDTSDAVTIGLYLNAGTLQFTDCSTIERWKVHNTFVTTGSDSDDIIEGYMGYHENKSTYPLVTDCSGTPVYNASGISVNGKIGPDLADTPIRHHRIPDCGGDARNYDFDSCDLGLTKRVWVDSDGTPRGSNGELGTKISLNKMGLIVDLSDVYDVIEQELGVDKRNSITGHYIMYSKRDEVNKTIIDKGYMWRNHNRANFHFQLLARGITSWTNKWYPYQYVSAFPATDDWLPAGSLSYDDYSTSGTALPCQTVGGCEGRIFQGQFEFPDRYRAELSYTSGLITYLNWGYNSGAATYITTDHQIGRSDFGGWHNTDANLSEYVSARSVFDKSIKLGDYVKVECSVSALHPSILASNSGSHDFSMIHVAAPDLINDNSYDYRTDKYWWEDNIHVDFNHIATYAPSYNLNIGRPGDVQDDYYFYPENIAYWGFHRRILGAALAPWNEPVTGELFTFPIEMSTQRYGQITPFYQLESPFPMPITPYNHQMTDMARGANSNRVGDTATYNSRILDTYMSNYYVSIKNSKDVFTVLESIIYLRMNTCVIPRDESTTTLIKGGDTWITRVRDVKTFSALGDGGNGKGEGFNGLKNIGVNFRGYMESDEVHASLAHSTFDVTQYPQKYFDRAYYLNCGRADRSFNRKILWKDVEINDQPDVPDDYGYREFGFEYNPDFGKQHEETPGFPVSDTYNYCDNCSAREPNSIYYSNKGFSEDTIDQFKLILADNKFNVPSETGEITNMFLEGDELYVHVEKALFKVETRPQTLDSSSASIFVGTGEIGSIPPKRIVSVPYGYAGSKDAFATISTQYGTFFVDREGGQVFLLKGGLNEISKRGMEQWFKDNLRLNLADQFYQLTGGSEYPIKDTSSDNSIGYQATYDSRMNRIVLHKKDYSIRETNDNGDPINFGGYGPLPVNPDVNTLYIRDSIINTGNVDWVYSPNGLQYVLVDLNDKDWFVNESWTISYSLDGNFWIGFHSYQPNFMYNDNLNIYSFINDGNTPDTIIWKHTERNFQTFYGTKYDHIIDITLDGTPQSEEVYYNVQFVSTAYLHDEDADYSRKIEDVTFDRFYVYNSSQCSTLRDLIVKTPNSYQDVTLPLSQTLMDRTDNYWRFNRFRDEITDRTRPFFTSRWNELQQYFDNDGQGYLDRDLDPIAIDGSRSIYRQARFRDKYCSVRVFFNNPGGDYKIKTELLTFLTNLSLR